MMDAVPADWELVLRELASGEEHEIPLQLEESVEIVNFVWSPDATSLLVVTASGGCSEQTRSVSLVDLQTGSMTTLIEESGREFFALEWSDPETAILRDGQGNKVQLNVETGDITEP